MFPKISSNSNLEIVLSLVNDSKIVGTNFGSVETTCLFLIFLFGLKLVFCDNLFLLELLKLSFFIVLLDFFLINFLKISYFVCLLFF